MASPQTPNPEQVDRKKYLVILMPAVLIAALVILIAVIGNVGGGSHPMSDGSNGSVDDPDLKELVPGVQYRDLKVGEGEPAPKNTTVKMLYSGWLPDGLVFDSSKDKPVTFELKGLIKGWQEGIPGMKPGGIRRLKIPADLAYGEKGRPGIPGGATLVFEIELFEAK